jgi:acyl-coenzyme A synthetase/AMP-(fatty) acid ligase
MRDSNFPTLRQILASGGGPGRRIRTAQAALELDEFTDKTSLGGRIAELEGRSIMLIAGDQLRTAASLIELDGVARRILLCPPDLALEHYPVVMRDAEVDALVFGADETVAQTVGQSVSVRCQLPLRQERLLTGRRATEWVLLTSGTSGDPKMVVHTLATLTNAFISTSSQSPIQNWATFYDIRRFGGLQIFLRALAGRGSLTLHEPEESVDDFLARAGAEGVTHISGTPTHWRLALMNPGAATRMRPIYVRLSGEVADRAVFDGLKLLYPSAQLVDAYASTEAGLAFEVSDGLEGFSASRIGAEQNGVTIQIVEGSLRIRSDRTALRYLGDQALLDADGFVDTGDLVERSGDRYLFLGRRGGIINVGGAKVNPEEVEAAINQHPAVRVCLVKARKNPITGAVVVADVELKNGEAPSPEIRREILALCANRLASYKVPALLRFVSSLPMTPSGKLDRGA